MSAMKDAFEKQADRGNDLIWQYVDDMPISDLVGIEEIAAGAIADILHAVAQRGHDFRLIGRMGVAYAEESGADIYEDARGGTRAAA